MRNNRFLPAFAAVAAALAIGVAACGGDDEGSTDGQLRRRRTRSSPARSGSTAPRRSSRSPRRRASSSTRSSRTSRSRSARPAPAAASRSSAPARPTSRPPRARSRTTKRPRSARRPASSTRRSRSPTTASPSSRTRTSRSTASRSISSRRSGSRARRCRTSARPARPPGLPVKLFGPGTDSGTFDFFTDQINGEEGASREDYEASEDDNQLVTGVSGTEGGLGYFGFSYYEAERRQAEPRRRRRGRGELQEARRGDDPGRLLQAALAPAVHVPVRQGPAAARGQGVHGVRGQQPGRDRQGLEDRRR